MIFSLNFVSILMRLDAGKMYLKTIVSTVPLIFIINATIKKIQKLDHTILYSFITTDGYLRQYFQLNMSRKKLFIKYSFEIIHSKIHLHLYLKIFATKIH